jgi:hypothetical protein
MYRPRVQTPQIDEHSKVARLDVNGIGDEWPGEAPYGIASHAARRHAATVGACRIAAQNMSVVQAEAGS